MCLMVHPSESKGSPISSVEFQSVWTKASTGTIQVTDAMWTQFRDLEHISSGFVQVILMCTCAHPFCSIIRPNGTKPFDVNPNGIADFRITQV